MRDLTRRSALATAAGALVAVQRVSRAAVPERHRLRGALTSVAVEKALIPRARWTPYPTAADRKAWDAVVPEIKETLVAAANQHRGKPYPPLPATLFLEYVRNGNRSHFETIQFGRRTHLRQSVLAECIEGKGRFLDDIVDGIWATCEETFWGIPAHIGAQKRGAGLPDVTEPIIDLFAAETAALLAWTDYLLGPQLDRVQPLVRARLAYETERRILAPYRDRDDFWWMGLAGGREVNNWNPWINSNCLATVLLMDADPARRARTVHKILTSVDRFLDAYHDDGGCDEGPSYWSRAGGSLFDSLELLHSATGGALNYYSMPLVGEIGKYICRVHIADDWFVNFADASAKIELASDLVYRYGAAIRDPDMQALAAYSRKPGFHAEGGLGRDLPAIFDYPTLQKAEARPPLAGEVWLPGIEVAAARVKRGSPDGFYFAALGGHNAESHNHNDVGNFVLFANGDPVLIDVGVETYTAKTFSPQRYEIWTMQSAYHNLPTINGVMQHDGREYRARNCSFTAGAGAAEFAADIAAAYPADAGIETWRRTLRLDRAKGTFGVVDRFKFARAAGAVAMNFMTACPVRAEGSGAVVLAGGLLRHGAVRIEVEGPAPPEIHTEEIAITDARLRSVWGERLYRTVMSWPNLPRTGELRFRMAIA